MSLSYPAIFTSRCVFSVIFLFVVVAGHSAEPIRFEAEDGALTGTVVSSSASGFSGTGYVRGFSDQADRVVLSFNATEGIYDIVVGFRTPGGEKGFNGALNGLGFSGHFEASDVWQRYELGVMALQDGENEIWIGGGWSYYEIDYVEIRESEPFPRPSRVDPVPVDPLASSEAKELLSYLSDRYGRLTLSGQQDIPELDIVENLTGVRPAILGGDLMDYSPSRVENGADAQNETENLIAQYEAGMIITVSWHWNAPTDLVESEEYPWWRGFYTEGTTFDFVAALDDPEGDNYQLILRDIDTIAIELKKLQEADVPVLWRPLHESDGGWFWWGTKGADNLRRLWVLLYDRLTEHHGIHNLIWVQTIEDLDWYAGDEYVDILGIDSYPDDPRDPLTGIWKRFLDRFDGKKIIALSEFGRVPDIPMMQSLGVWFSYFMSWNGDLGAGGMPDTQALQAIYTSDEVVDYAELGAPDADGDGLDSVLELAFGSSDDESDSNGDLVSDGLSVRLGYEPLFDLSGLGAFYGAEDRRLEFWSSEGVMFASMPLGLDLSLSDLESMELVGTRSSDLVVWDDLDIRAEDFVETSDESAVLKVYSDDNAVFLKLTAQQR
ncbi:glycosyl hydrolase [Pelagicoccus mobilis]|uniref:GH26 domain-containing protein n=1 Tax=Pelagicoccus mobilis TaxID=415221 RepID=A0A934RWT7_9BACT|nr:glycosyl hydrolase [Pelagicoccus mobilis]MBK1879190.1 hypothetical protein [Pelagicoccus mobilis]